AGGRVKGVGGFLVADSRAYLASRGLIGASGHGTMDQFCRACFDGAYPVPVPQQLEMDKMALELPLPPMPVVPAVPPSSTPPVVPTQAASWGAEAGGPSRERGRASRAGAVPRECGRG